ncbi:MAG: hypothetical protein IPH59_05225 [bacterium]|nr:hypothetical protein [bacterium]
MSSLLSLLNLVKSVALLVCLLTSVAQASVPSSFTYQGRLTDAAGTALNEVVALTFGIYSDSLGTKLIWSEMHPTVTVTEGLFTIVLGQANPLTVAVFDGSIRWIGVSIDGEAELRPLRPLLSVPGAFQAIESDTAGHAKTIADNSVTTSKIANGTIAFTDIGQNGATSGQVMKWNGSNWAAAADAVSSNTSGWTDNGTVVSLTNPIDTVALNTSSRLGKLNFSGDLGMSGQSAIYFGSANARLESLVGNDMKWVGADLSLLSTESVYFTELGVDTWAEFDNVNRRVGIGTINPDDRLHIENSEAGTCWLKIQGSHPTNWGQTGLRIQTPANTWHLRQDLYTHANFPEGALSLYSSAMSEEAMTWLENGNVGIGTANPTRKLQVDGSIQVDDTLYAGAIKPSLMAASRLPDEAGFATSFFFSPAKTITSDPHTVLTAEIVVPASGYVLGVGFCEFQIDHTWGDVDEVYASIVEDTTYYWVSTAFGYDDDVESGNFKVTASPNSVFWVSEQDHTHFALWRPNGDLRLPNQPEPALS